MPYVLSNWVHWKKCLKFVDSYEGYEVQWSCNKYWGQKTSLTWKLNGQTKKPEYLF